MLRRSLLFIPHRNGEPKDFRLFLLSFRKECVNLQRYKVADKLWVHRQ